MDLTFVLYYIGERFDFEQTARWLPPAWHVYSKDASDSVLTAHQYPRRSIYGILGIAAVCVLSCAHVNSPDYFLLYVLHSRYLSFPILQFYMWSTDILASNTELSRLSWLSGKELTFWLLLLLMSWIFLWLIDLLDISRSRFHQIRVPRSYSVVFLSSTCCPIFRSKFKNLCFSVYLHKII